LETLQVENKTEGGKETGMNVWQDRSKDEETQ